MLLAKQNTFNLKFKCQICDCMDSRLCYNEVVFNSYLTDWNSCSHIEFWKGLYLRFSVGKKVDFELRLSKLRNAVKGISNLLLLALKAKMENWKKLKRSHSSWRFVCGNVHHLQSSIVFHFGHNSLCLAKKPLESEHWWCQ